ncbi:alpha-L-iduronidase-like [Corticium candelabrum]|uniref:alpha-L-iduronidase-like n=1 Tax=Corticium candelabrum TaxID=121492 RepID=UPI002E265F2C|nr:alpha-L-iduronidase-like [Corticium candelabrum]
MASLFLFLSLFVATCVAEDYEISVNVNDIVREVSPFWHSTGFCPPLPHEKSRDYDLAEDEIQNIIYIGSIPNNGIEQVRIHWLLDLVTLEKNSSDHFVYNFTFLDILLDHLHDNGLRPGFEIMGNPSDYFTTFDDDKQVREWRELVMSLGRRYIDRYGVEYVEKWNFETWNEPDHHDFDTLNITLNGFMNYYDACSEGLLAASPRLKLGGPGGSCREPPQSPICWGLLDHCINGKNYFTGETGVRIDFISFHHKGGGVSMNVLEQELETMTMIREKYPRLATVPIYNDEADPLVGWSRGESWRSDARYAAVVVKIIAQHFHLLLDPSNSPYSLLSNDNGFMNFGPPNFFDQRTLNTRFPMNKTVPKSVEIVRKPVAVAMGLLSLLGEMQLKSNVTINNQTVGNDSSVGVIASLHLPMNQPDDSVQISIIVYNSNDTAELVPSHDVVRLTISNLVPQNVTVNEMVCIHYRLDNNHTNPDAVWEQGGKPDFPSATLFASMRAQQDPVTIAGPSIVKPELQWTDSFDLPLPAVDLIHFCSKPMAAPSQVSQVRLHQVHKNEVLVSWTDVSSRCLLMYNVYYSLSRDVGYKRVSTHNSIFTLLSHQVPDLKSVAGVTVYYKVAATDYWQREGAASLPVKITL